RRALPPGGAPVFLPGGQPRARTAVRRALPARRRDAMGPQALLGRAAHGSGPAHRRARHERRRPAAAVRSPARDRAVRRGRLPRQRRGRRARSRRQTDPADHAGTGGSQAVQRRGARLRARDAKGGRAGRSGAGGRRDDHAAPQARRVRPGADDLAGRARRRGGRAVRVRRCVQLRRLPIEHDGRDARRGAQRRRPGRARADPGAHREAPHGRSTGDLPLSLRRPRAGRGPRPRSGGGGRSLRPSRRVAGMIAALLAMLFAATPAAPAPAPPPATATPAPAAGCLPATALAGPGIVDPFHAPLAEATELNSAGKTYYRDGKWEEARIEYRAAFDADPAFLAPRLNVACSFVRQERFEEATTEVEALLKLAYVPWAREILEAADLGALKPRPEMAR